MGNLKIKFIILLVGFSLSANLQAQNTYLQLTDSFFNTAILESYKYDFTVSDAKNSVNQIVENYISGYISKDHFEDQINSTMGSLLTNFGYAIKLSESEFNTELTGFLKDINSFKLKSKNDVTQNIEQNQIEDFLTEEQSTQKPDPTNPELENINNQLIDSKYNLIFDEWFDATNSYGIISKINIKIIVPNDFETSTSGEIILEFYTENWAESSSLNQSLNYIENFELNIITNEKGFELSNPTIEVFKKNSFEDLKDISDSKRKAKVFWGNYLPIILSAIPYNNIGKAFSIGNASINLANWWSNSSENDFSSFFKAVSEFDFYPLQTPRNVENLGVFKTPARAYRIRYNYKKLQDANFMSVVFNKLHLQKLYPVSGDIQNKTRSIADIVNIPIYKSESNSRIITNNHSNQIKLKGSETINLYKNPVRIKKQPSNSEGEHSKPDVDLQVSYELVKNYNGGDYVLKVKLNPLVIPNLSDRVKDAYKYGISIIDVTPSIIVPKGNIVATELPKFTDYQGRTKPFITLKQENSYKFWDSVAELMLDVITFGTIKLFDGYEQAINSKYLAETSLPYTQQIIKQWHTLNEINLFQFPRYKNFDYNSNHPYPKNLEGCEFEFPIKISQSKIEDDEIKIVLNGFYEVAEYYDNVTNQIFHQPPTTPLAEQFSVEINLKNVEKKIRYLYSSNGGLKAYYNDGTWVGCPRCDYDEKNINNMSNFNPDGTYKVNEDGSVIQLSEDGSTTTEKPYWFNNSEGWIIIDYEMYKKNTSSNQNNGTKKYISKSISNCSDIFLPNSDVRNCDLKVTKPIKSGLDIPSKIVGVAFELLNKKYLIIFKDDLMTHGTINNYKTLQPQPIDISQMNNKGIIINNQRIYLDNINGKVLAYVLFNENLSVIIAPFENTKEAQEVLSKLDFSKFEYFFYEQ